MLSSQAEVETYRRGQFILRAGSSMDREGQVRISWGAAGGSSRNSRGETVAVMKRLEILGEALILNDETVISWNFIASSDHTSVIVIERSLFTEALLNDIRKDLQVQLVALGLQRLPSFLELSSEQLYSLARHFDDTAHVAGEEITKCGDVLGPEARIYVVQNGTICLSKSADDEMVMTPRGSHISYTSRQNVREPRDSGIGFWGSRLGSLLKSGSTPQSPRNSNVVAGALTTQDLLSLSQGLGGSTKVRKGGSPRQSIGCSSPWTLTTYGVFGDECLLTRASAKDESYWPPCKTTSVVESSRAICLSVTIAKLTSILGPIQELLTRLTNTKVLG
ncbi:uncharacterized protein LOC112341079 [Selaginella moellendorffii]|uniref:uncharacterized protein LOC112341079 n=1 Tax=Selaginella moellendorffii TaxID=88036 RepID=UPI000D1C8DAB|nr:uncharacterized protein LOC112341079 [Selaginella moellendorffii]|eukprot:XP_024516318.1 uncharacterized protein LOC112341079 [Selaginella moellendorffii]